uniref:Phosphoprotein n=1 Tax=Avian paramyxovirus 1 TaxID=2560319 RepID=A0A411ID23_NCDV|nr:phosphoprotein [avian paramyxovirus 1]QBB85569.1 phosphoprotein [avian paramyxovirus 1]QBB85575.1 phosphoprotein [avian paramyxovirus 1]QBB85581.1 phosphoprotein [avian paramyxovirus 1]QBB85587.1 phosphoprotein [avian paramyxovirus 1]
MATFTDAEIDELFETSGTVIDSIITAQGKPVETVGRSAIPQGKTKALSLAWEKHGSTNTPAAQESAGEQDQHGQNQASNNSRAAPEEGPHSSQAQAATQPQEDANESQLKTGASSSLLSMLDKLSNKSSNAKKGPPQSPPQQAIHSKGNPAVEQTQHGANQGRAQRETGHQAAPSPGPPGTGANIAFPGQRGVSPQSVGATQPAPQSGQNQGSTPASADHVQPPVDFVQAMMSMMEAISQRVSKIDYQLDLVLKQTSSIPTMRSEIQQLKTSVAVMEANLGMMKILDPGCANVSSLSDLRAVAKSHPVLIAGPGDPSPYVTQGGEIALNKLSQPVPHPSDLIKHATSGGPDIGIERDTVRALILSRPMHPSSSSKLLSKLDSAGSVEEIRKIKRLALNG